MDERQFQILKLQNSTKLLHTLYMLDYIVMQVRKVNCEKGDSTIYSTYENNYVQ